MDYRRWCWWAEWGVVAAVVGLHGVIFFVREQPGRPDIVLEMARDAQFLALVVFLLCLIVFGAMRLWIRAATLAVLVCVWFVQGESALPLSFRSLAFLSVALVMVALRVAGVRLLRSHPAEPERPGQFSLSSLLLATTTFAMLIGLLEGLRPVLNGYQSAGGAKFASALTPMVYQLRIMILSITGGLFGVGGAWVVLRSRGMAIRGIGLTAAIVFASLYLAHLTSDTNPDISSTTVNLELAFMAVATMCGVSVLPLRVMGFRLSRIETGSGNESAARSPLPVARKLLAGEAQ